MKLPLHNSNNKKEPPQSKRDVAVPGFGLGTPRVFSMYSLLAVMYLVAKYLSELLLSQIVSLESSSRNLLVDWRSMFVCARSSGIVAGHSQHNVPSGIK